MTNSPMPNPTRLEALQPVWNNLLGDAILTDMNGNEIELKLNEFNHDKKFFKIKIVDEIKGEQHLMVPCPIAFIEYNGVEYHRNYLLLWGESAVVQVRINYRTNVHPEYPDHIWSIDPSPETDFVAWLWKSDAYAADVKVLWNNRNPEDNCQDFSPDGRFKLINSKDHFEVHERLSGNWVWVEEFVLNKTYMLADVLLVSSHTNMWDWFVWRINTETDLSNPDSYLSAKCIYDNNKKENQ